PPSSRPICILPPGPRMVLDRSIARRFPLVLWFGFQLRLVLLDERADVVRHVEELRPLLLVERHREAAEPVDRHASLLAHLHGDSPAAPRLERLVLGLQALHLCFHLLLVHPGSSCFIAGWFASSQVPLTAPRTL